MNDMSSKNQPKHFLDLHQIPTGELRKIIELAKSFRSPETAEISEDIKSLPSNSILGMIFEKPSTRTRVSFDVAMRRLGGQSIVLNSNDMQLGRGETVADTAKVLSRFVDAIMIRTSAHDKLLDLATNATIPVINGLTDDSHPCQIMADVQTYEEHLGSIKNQKITWLGDGNNVANSWIHAAERFEFDLWLACPKKFFPNQKIVDAARKGGATIHVTTDIDEACQNSSCLVTDTWVSMGDDDAAERHAALAPYQVNADMMAQAAPDAIFMHCLPAHRGEEVTAEVMDGPQSVVFDEAENRMHVQQAILAWCFNLI